MPANSDGLTVRVVAVVTYVRVQIPIGQWASVTSLFDK